MITVTKLSIMLHDGTVWPRPDIDPGDLTAEKREQHFASLADAWDTLLLHPQGSEAAVKTLRNLRRAMRVSRQAR